MKIAITGDFFVYQPHIVKIDSEVSKILQEVDLSIVNLEAPVADSLTQEPPLKSGVRLLQPPQVVNLLDDLGIDALTLANNHIMDYGMEGYRATLSNLSNKYSLLGCGSWNEAYKMFVYEKDGLKVGIISLCEFQYGMLSDRWVQGNDALGCAWINHPKVDELIVNSKKQVDKLIAICHCGIENEPVPLPEWRDRYRQLVRLGCDAVVAHHPHMVQGYEIYQSAPICYSLGNFCFECDIPMSEEWNTGCIAILEVTKEGITISTQGVKLTNQQTLLLRISENEWQTYLDARNHMLDGDEYLKRVDDMCARKLDMYYQLFSMGGLFKVDRHWPKNIARILTHKYNPIHALNNMQCESHRWCICRGLNNLK